MAENYRRALTEDEIPTAFRNVYGDRTKKPISVQTAEIGMDVVSPLPTIINIQKELEKKDPSYVKIAGLAGLELLGSAAPVVELAAKSANKSVLQKIVNYFKKNPGKEYNPESAKVSAKDLGFGEDVYHFTTSKKIKGDKFNPDLSIGNWNRMGIHVGAKKAASDRFRQTQGIDKYEDGKALTELSPGEYFEADAKGMTIPLKARTDKPLLFDGEVKSEFAIIGKLQEMAVKKGIGKDGDYATALRKELAKEGYTHIPYINEVENEGAISYIMLTDRPKKSSAVMRSKFADFDPDKIDRPELGLAEGGVMIRPEPRPDIVDVSPRAEAGDQFFVEQAERNKPFPNVKPKPRPNLDKNKGRTYDIYSVEIDGRETNVIEFKDGSRLSIPQIEQMFEGSKSATESTPGKQTTKEIINFLESNNPTREEFVKHFTAKRLNKGGAMMEEQMQMAFMDEGGLKDDGMEKDPVSGNEVPSGSMAKEVRDDIPAQLSEGEYVVPADVVRYYGVKFFEDLRERAKIGLQDMEMNGRIGGEPVPAGGPVNNEELSPEEMQAIQEMMGMAQGGAVNMYKQQQELYTAPNPAMGNPMQMNQGGQVSGYDQAGAVTANQPAPVPAPPVTSASVEQDMLQAGAAAQQSNFGGFTLGATIFPSEATGKTILETMAEPTPQTITLYSPDYLTDKQTITVTLPAQDALYQEKITEKPPWTTEPPVAAPSSGGGGGGGGGDDPPKTDPNAWAKGLSAGNSMEWVKANLSGKKTGSGFLNNIGLAQNYARSAALANIAEAQGNTTLAEQIRGAMATKYEESQFLQMMPGEFIDGDQIQRRLGDTIDLSVKTTTTPKKQFLTPPSDSDKKKANIAASKKQSSKGTSSSKAKAIIKAKAAGISTDTAKKLSGSQMIAGSDVGAGPGGTDITGPMNKGGLMTKGKKK